MWENYAFGIIYKIAENVVNSKLAFTWYKHYILSKYDKNWYKILINKYMFLSNFVDI